MEDVKQRDGHLAHDLIQPYARRKRLVQQATVVLLHSPLPGAGLHTVDPHLRLFREETGFAYSQPLVV